MKVLVLESERGRARPVEEQLVAEGHTVLRCDSSHGTDAVACRGLEIGGDCPLDADDVDVAVVARRSTELTASEHGALCATRQRIPLVVVGDTRTQPFGEGVWSTPATAAPEDVVTTLRVAAKDGRSHADAVRRDLVELGLLDGDGAGVGIDVVRSSRRLELTLHMPEGLPRHAAIVKAAAEALRRYDGTAAVIDVRVVH